MSTVQQIVKTIGPMHTVATRSKRETNLITVVSLPPRALLPI
jgi:hypothetical protein